MSITPLPTILDKDNFNRRLIALDPASRRMDPPCMEQIVITIKDSLAIPMKFSLLLLLHCYLPLAFCFQTEVHMEKMKITSFHSSSL